MRKLKTIFSSEFSKNVLTLMTGTTIAQAIPIAITPILTRIYRPEDFGVLALFMAITAVLGAIANGKYELAIMLPKSNIEALNIVYLSVIISSLFSLLLFIVILLFKSNIIVLLGEPEIENWLYFVPITVLAMGLYNALLVYNNRIKKYRDISISSVSKSTGQSLAQILIGFLKAGPMGLIFGQVLSYFAGNIILIKNTLNKNNFNDSIDKKIIMEMAKKHKKFPSFSMPSVFLNSINLNSVSFLISSIFSVTTLGFYSLTQRIIGIPASVIGKSFSQIYYQKASEQYNKSNTTEAIFLNTLKKLFLIGIPIFTIAFFVVEPLFSFVFGDEWVISGTYSKIIIPLAFTRFVSSTLSVTTSVHNKQQYGLYINILLLFSTIGIFYFSYLFEIDFENFLKYLTIVLSLEYLFFLLLYWKISQNKL